MSSAANLTLKSSIDIFMDKKKSRIQRSFDVLLKYFEEDTWPEVKTVLSGNGIQTIQEYEVELPENLVMDHPYIVFVMFVYLKQFKFFGQEEKVAWTIPVKYKGEPFILTHRKFGFSIISNSDTEEVKKLGIEAMNYIKKAIPCAEVLFEPLVREQFDKGKITLENEYVQIKSRYQFFRDKAATAFDEAAALAGKSKSIKTEGIDNIKGFEEMFSKFIAHHNGSAEHLMAGNNFATAMLDSYFCLIEHTFVLLLPFLAHIKTEEINLESFIGENWSGKLKKVLPLADDKEAMLLYERLNRIKEELRNPLTHGYFLRGGDSFLVHMPQIGAIPMNLTKQNSQFRYGFFPIEHMSFEEICRCFDDFDSFLNTRAATKYGMRFIDTGMSIAFDSRSSQMYQAAMTSDEDFEQFCWAESARQTDAMNMDW